jgi:hypothetical protein
MFKVILHESKTVSWWLNKANHIDFNPSFQRKGNIWTQKNKAYLVDSIVNELDMPKIYLADFSFVRPNSYSEDYTYAIVDGKQRLSAIFDFLQNKYPLNKDCIYYKDESVHLGGMTYKDIIANYPTIANNLREYNLTIMTIITDEVEKIEELFKRLNFSKPLTGAEIRSASGGVVPVLINEISEHIFFTQNIRFSTQRGNQKNAIAKILLCEEKKELTNVMKRNLDDFALKHLKTDNDTFEDIVLSIFNNLDRLSNIFIQKDPLLKTSGPLILYYWLVRNTKPRYDKYLREFLNQISKVKDGANVKFIDKNDWLLYSFHLRSINNGNSLKVGSKFLEQWFNKFLKLLVF